MEELKYIWHTFVPQICDLLKELQQSKKFCDATLVCDDQKQLKAHKFILSACSSVFKNMFENGDSTSSTIYLRGIKSQDMDSVLQFLYLGETTIYQDNVDEFLNVAKDLGIEGIGNRNEFVYVNENSVDKVKNESIKSVIEDKMPDIKQQEIGPRLDLSKQTPGPWAQSPLISCKFCDKTLTTKAGLHHHVKSIHDGKKYPCSKCEYRATSSGNLLKHFQAIHEGKRFSCKYCDYKSTQISHIDRHVRSKHMPESEEED